MFLCIYGGRCSMVSLQEYWMANTGSSHIPNFTYPNSTPVIRTLQLTEHPIVAHANTNRLVSDRQVFYLYFLAV